MADEEFRTAYAAFLRQHTRAKAGWSRKLMQVRDLLISY
jgi:hypothetical protein